MFLNTSINSSDKIQFSSSRSFSNTVVLLILLFVLPACTTNWPDPYSKPEPVVVAPRPAPVPEVIPEPLPPMVETMPLPDNDVTYTPAPNAPTPPPVIEAEPELAAVVSLRGQAADSMAAGEPDMAAATIERALRIQPRNPVLWLDLAAVRFAQNEYSQAESTAKRALTYAGSKRDVSYDAWNLIASSRYARNDTEGGQRAEAEATQYR